ncbi:MAG: hypothetical protein HQ534_10875 [Armatimonadetes bacterium]|nr:hypothetical protein [Armatimonadota bacterium]
MIKKLIKFALLMGLLPIIGCNERLAITEEFRETYDLGSGTKLNVSNKNGGISISNWENSFIEVFAIKKTFLNEDELKKVEIIINQENDEFNIQTEYPTKNAKVSVSYEIKVPSYIIVNDILTSNGKISLQGTTGNSILKTSNGKIFVRNVDGIINANTSNGKISIFETKGIIYARTSNGKIEVELPDIIDQDIDVSTSNGAIKIYLSPETDAELEMKTTNGKISLNDIKLIVSKISSTHVKGELGIGGNRINIRTSNGNINLYSKKNLEAI